MKALIALTMVASLAHMPALAGIVLPPAVAASAQLDPVPLVPASFPTPIAITRTSIVLDLDQALVLIDPVGNQQQYRGFGRPDIVVLTRAHPDHLSIDTMIGLLRRDTVVLAPQSVIDRLPLMIANNVITPFEIGSTQNVKGITFRAFAPGAGLPAGTQAYQRDRGDIGVVIEVAGTRLYF